MAEIFRKSALDKLSSPDQLDKMIVVTSPMPWLVALGGFIVVLSAVIWGVVGRIPQNIESSGIIISGDGTGVTYSEVAGIVDEVYAEIGQKVEKGQIVAHIDATDVSDEIAVINNRIHGVENVTLDSLNDVPTADNKNLIDLKSEVIALQTNLSQAQRNLDVVNSEISLQQNVVNASNADMNLKKSFFYNSINSSSGAREQVDYSEAQSDLASGQSYVDSIKSSVSSAQASVNQAKIQKEEIEKTYEASKLNKEQKKLDYENMISELSGLEVQLQEEQIKPSPDQSIITDLNSQILVKQEEEKNALAEYEAAMVDCQTLESSYASAEQNLKMAEASLEAIKGISNGYESRLENSEAEYNSSKEAYIAYQDWLSQANKSSSVANNEYNWALNQYSTEKSKLDSLNQSKNSLKAEVESVQEQVEAKKKQIEQNFNSTKNGIIDNLKLELEKLKRNLQKTDIVATQSGVIKEVVVTNGGVLQAGGEVIKVTSGDVDSKSAICYVPVAVGKKVEPGMEVMLYPTTTNKQEHGHMVGTVMSVEKYITSQTELMKTVGDTTLAESFLRSGPIVEVVCSIMEDEKTESGFYWSSKKGKDIQINEGTIFTANIVTEKKAPITMVIPYLKEKLTVKPSQKENQ